MLEVLSELRFFDHMQSRCGRLGRHFKYYLGLGLLILAGCGAGEPDFVPADLRGFNHTASDINYFSVNGWGGSPMSAHGQSGATCCVAIPARWAQGIKLNVEWEKNTRPDLAREFPGYIDRVRYLEWEEKFSSFNESRSAEVEYPYFEGLVCSFEIHFMPCDEVKISTSCARYPSPGSPIKEPLKMKEYVCKK